MITARERGGSRLLPSARGMAELIRPEGPDGPELAGFGSLSSPGPIVPRPRSWWPTALDLVPAAGSLELAA
ncbi:MAG TPA: hypothetical protein VGS19_34560 [Streptosporangiaceae bacterium]|nr:hypothetical protein [Streptosporangiaceae bacterium]